MGFKQISPEALTDNPFQMIGKDWMLVSAADAAGKVNTMTASWGGVGIMWGKPVAFVFIRPQRYTKEFVDQADTLSLTVLDGSMRDKLNYLGTVSGRDEDKITKSGLTLAFDGNTPYFEEGRRVLLCRKLYAQELYSECFIDENCDSKWYPNSDYHTMYVVEIEKLLTKE